jgi:hypothetical protein
MIQVVYFSELDPGVPMLVARWAEAAGLAPLRHDLLQPLLCCLHARLELFIRMGP